MNKVVVGLIIFSIGSIALSLVVTPVNANNWKHLKTKEDKFVYSLFQPLDLDTLKVSLMQRVPLSATYKYNFTICNLTLGVTRFNNLQANFVNNCWNGLVNLGRNTLNRNYNLDIPFTGAFLIKFGNGTEESIISSDDPTEDVLLTLCGDNQTYYWNESIETSWMVLGNPNQSATINGSWYETLMTYDTHPKCTSFNPYTINMTCLTQSCSSIVQLNKLTGNVTTIWQTGEVW